MYKLKKSRRIAVAISISGELVRRFGGNGERLRMLSAHEHACNLVSDGGTIVSLVHPSVGNGPFHIVLTRPVSFAALDVDDPAQWSDNSIRFKHFTIDLSPTMVWDPALPRVGAPIPSDAWHSLREHIRQADPYAASDQTALDAAMVEREQQAAERLLVGLRTGQEDEIVRGTELLAGLGVGLTPAGDDFLLGFMARIWLDPALLPPNWTAPDLCQRIACTAGPRTTHLSRTWLDYAARGQFAEPWHGLAAALAVSDQNAIHLAADRILSIGASSGQDAMAGFLIMNRSYAVRND